MLIHPLVKRFIGILSKCKIPRIPLLFVQDKYITNCKEKVSTFFSSQCTPLSNDIELPALRFRINSRISSFEITFNEISDIIAGLNRKKAHGLITYL